FSVTVVLGLLHIRVPEPGAGAAHTAAETAGEYWRRYPQLDALFGRAERGEVEEDIDIDLEDDDDEIGARGDDDEDETQGAGVSASASSMRMSAEDQAIFALLDQPVGKPEGSSELDALLDQVLEFAPPKDEIEE